MKALFKSKKFWLTVFGVAGVIAGKWFGIDDSTISDYTTLIMTLVAAIAGVDIAATIKGAK
jgi:uncharacterized membrane protein